MATDELKSAISDLANAVQTLALLATKMRSDLSESAQHAAAVEAAVEKAAQALGRLQPRQEGI